MKKGIVYLKGGLGNQLFQLSFANYLSKNGFLIYLNTEKLIENNNNTRRELIFPISNFNMKLQPSFDNIAFKIFHKFESSNIIRNSFMYRYFSEFKFTKEKDNIFDVNSKRFFFDGYWKNEEYIRFSKKFIEESISKDIQLEKAKKNKENKTMVHIRRKDFVVNNWDLKISFYENAFKILNTKLGHFRYDIFTDDEDWVNEHELFSTAENIYIQRHGGYDDYLSRYKKDDKNETLETFEKMLSYQHYIVGNSSFSFWAAFLAEDTDSIVIVADPWFREQYHPVLKLENWLTAENKY